MQVDMRAQACMNMHVDMSVLVVGDLTSARCTGFAHIVQLQLSVLQQNLEWFDILVPSMAHFTFIGLARLFWPLKKCSMSYLSLPYLTFCGRHFTAQC